MPDGIKCLNILFNNVKKDRNEQQKFDRNFIKAERKSQETQGKPTNQKSKTIEAAHLLWDKDGNDGSDNVHNNSHDRGPIIQF